MGATGSAPAFLRRLEAVALPPPLAAAVAPLRALLTPLNEQIAAARFAAGVHADAVMRWLTTVPGVGPVTATTLVATLDTVARFAGPHQVAAYLGLVPSERSSGERQQRGAITKAGNRRARSVLVQAAWGLLRTRDAEAVALRTWAQHLAARRGKRVAVVALARRIAGILYALARWHRVRGRTRAWRAAPGVNGGVRHGGAESAPVKSSESPALGAVSAKVSLAAVESRLIGRAPHPRIPQCAGDPWDRHHRERGQKDDESR